MSSMPLEHSAEEESNFLLMLGKPGGGKGMFYVQSSILFNHFGLSSVGSFFATVNN